MKKENIIGVSFFIVVVVVFLLWQLNKEKSDYRNRGQMTTGVVLQVIDDYKGRPYVHYRFNVDTATFYGEDPYPEFRSRIEEQLKNKRFPVIYLKDKPAKNHILISRAEFKRFSIPFPDSLSWTIKLEF